MNTLIKVLFVSLFVITLTNNIKEEIVVQASKEPYPFLSAQLNQTEEYTIIIQDEFLMAIQLLPEAKKLPAILERIRWCESGNNPSSYNKESGASGLFQFIKSTWKYTMRKMGLDENSNPFDGELNTKAAIYLFDEQGSRPWLASAKCWSN